MKEKLTALLVILALCAFTVFLYIRNNSSKVLVVKSPVQITVDLNSNGVADEDENICIPNITSYTANLELYADEIKELKFAQGIAMGYLADDFAKKELLGKNVKVKFTGEKTPQCRFAEIYTDKGCYSKLLKSSGFAIANGKFVNLDNAFSILKNAEKLKLVIFNHKSEKFHKLDCKYGRIAHDAVILEKKELPSSARACKFCHIKEKTKSNSKNPYRTAKVPNIISDGSVKLILTDYTEILKPDRECRHEVCRELVKNFNSVQKSADIALYGWADVPKLKIAIENAIKRGVKVRVIYDTQTSNNNYYPETENLLKIIIEKRSDHIEGNSKLTNHLMHNKFIVFDNKMVYTGSMNFSITGLSGFNQNAVIILNSADIAKLYTSEFEQMFNGKFHTLKTTAQKNSFRLSDGSRIEIYFSPQDKGLTRAVLPLVKNAKKYIYIPAFLITHKPLTNALIESHKKGVDVKIILDATSIGTRNSALSLLRQAGIPVKLENYAGKMHSKSMIIDDKYIITGSANFSNSGENKNDENQIIIENSKLAKFYREFFRYLWAKIPDKYLKYNPPAESKSSIGSCSDGLDNDYDGKIDTNDEGCR